MTTLRKSTELFTGSEVWAALVGLALGLAGSGALRWGSRHRRTRSVLLPLGLNLAALALLGAVLASGAEPGGLGSRWTAWLVPAGAGFLLGTLGFRFPRSAGVPLVVIAVLGTWLVSGALRSFVPQGASLVLPTVQPLSDRETVTAFAWRVDFFEPPSGLPLVPKTLVRIRPGDAAPAEWWWSWAVSQGWARSEGAPIPPHPMKFGIYRMILTGDRPGWTLVAPETGPPDQ